MVSFLLLMTVLTLNGHLILSISPQARAAAAENKSLAADISFPGRRQ